MSDEFTESTLPNAVRWLFEANGYDIEGPIHYHGAEIDLVASSRSGLGRTNTYIEVTVQYVDTSKYGKDLTKLEMFRNEPGAQRLIVSSKGFTPEVKERASQAGILTFTYDDLFRNFEKTAPYVQLVLGDSSDLSRDLKQLSEVYEEPLLKDAYGKHGATRYITEWRNGQHSDNRWLVVVGEYGTGKTALTQMLLRRWTQKYAEGTGTPLPFRIELRDFSRQFDARGLLHHFLDRNDLGHLPIEFVESMIANGRVILLLDGYDEMAQYLNVRERRTCLEALAELARDGARGILTSRPNYFTEAEELRVFDVLYKKLTLGSNVTEIDRKVLDQEKKVDSLLDGFVLHRQERQLNDLTPEQTKQLVERHLSDDPVGAKTVIGILDRVFRADSKERSISLSGKPVIVSYLLEVVGELKSDASEAMSSRERFTEWQIFDLVLNKLMLRDHNRTPELLPSERRKFLGDLAFFLTDRRLRDIDEHAFRDFIVQKYAYVINRRRMGGEIDAVEALFDDLRSSSTLTRVVVREKYHWQFSHNSLREFLLVENLIEAHLSGKPLQARIPITDSMRLFAATMPIERRSEAVQELAARWRNRELYTGLSQILSLLWDGLLALPGINNARDALTRIAGPGLDLRGTVIEGLALAGSTSIEHDLSGLRMRDSEFVETDFRNCVLDSTDFSNSVFDGCVFRSVRAAKANFSGALMIDCDISQFDCLEGDFTDLYEGSNALISGENGVETLEGSQLIGYLKYCGAKTDPIDPYYVYSYSRDFDILLKICRYLIEQTWRQRRGIEQRGVAGRNVPLARRFVKFLMREGFAQEKNSAPDLIGCTPDGRAVIIRFLERQETSDEMAEFMRQELLK
ncbi:hypothetical protein GCM10029978_049330 [Actinoallomurus acanthiterrae]